MKVIALTSADENTMAAVAEQLVAASADRGLQLSVLIGIRDAHEAQAVYATHGELWRIGTDDSKPELDALVDRTLSDTHFQRLPHHVEHALERFLNKTRISA